MRVVIHLFLLFGGFGDTRLLVLLHLLTRIYLYIITQSLPSPDSARSGRAEVPPSC